MKNINKYDTEECVSTDEDYDEMMDRMIREHTESKKHKKSNGETSKTIETVEVKEKTAIKRPYIAIGDSLYLTVRDEKNKSLFAYLEDGDIKYAESIRKDGEPIYPQDLPYNRGTYYSIVGIPLKEMVEQAEQLDLVSLCNMIEKHLCKYIDMPKADVKIFTYYVMFTWFYVKVNNVPYLRLLGDTGKGKSRILRVISDICFYPVSAGGNSSASGIIRFNELWHGTLRVDEADINGGAENELVKYFNLGFERGQPFIKTNPVDLNKSDYFDPFCPKIFAMRRPFPDNATEGRLISFSPRETTRKDIPVNLPPVYENEVEKIRAIIAKFVISSWKHLNADNLYEYADLPIEARLKQMAAPLSLLFQLIPEGEKKFRDYILQRQKDLREVRSLSKEGEAFNQLYSLAIGEVEAPTNYEEFCMEDGTLSAVSPEMLKTFLGENATRALRSIGVTVENNRIPTNSGDKKKTRRYVFGDGDAWREAFQRYYFSDSEEENMNGIPACPEALKSRRYTDISTVY